MSVGSNNEDQDIQPQNLSESLLENNGFGVEVKSKNDVRNFKKHRRNLTAALAGGFLAFGFTVASTGVSLPTFADNLRVPIRDISSLIVARGFGYLVGSLACGLLSRKLSAYVLLVSAMFVIAIGVAFIPTILNIYALFVFGFIMSAGLSAYETIGNVALLQMWGSKSEPVLQFLHFFFCFGAAVIPFIMKPFLNEVHEDRYNHSSGANYSYNYSAFPEINLIGSTSIPYISIPYFFICSIMLLLIFFVLVTVPTSTTKQSASQQKNTEEEEGFRFRVTVLTFLFFFYFFYIGLEISFNSFLFTFGLTNAPGMSLSKEFSVYLNSVLYFAVVLGQFFAIFLSKKFSPTVIIAADLTGVAVSTLFMVLLPLYGETTPVLFWIGVGGFGLFRASIYGTTFLWAERYITVNARAASIFIIGGATGELILPLPVGLLIENYPLSFLYINTGYTAMVAILFVIMWKVASSKGERLQRIEKTIEDKSEEIK